MDQQPAVYRIYLVTIWQGVNEAAVAHAPEQQQNAARDLTWRFTLEDPRTGQRRSFSNAVALAAALQAEFPETPSQSNEDARCAMCPRDGGPAERTDQERR
ncbi:MAG TPA: hypothetical protein P5121_17275 [Caldilineaceae bacterium]|nr:hypothetical protein [Caldilineaceae bacterium]